MQQFYGVIVLSTSDEDACAAQRHAGAVHGEADRVRTAVAGAPCAYCVHSHETGRGHLVLYCAFVCVILCRKNIYSLYTILYFFLYSRLKSSCYSDVNNIQIINQI